uniref:Ppx/GppA phosphatase domain-containing protein n=1 Tax=Chromera velia CCMP2878 TaxID=1169474 RepID=A0A0G4GJ42_9ALVE|eukprot:Cvel_22116.t1-p1 / transcript=Cvel_22116.t1 / gene=Cvel_22116 / organism=Chromera_velia_CCMP2878 / gene_product=hypothetical protein / transcript_product=hypothetical protein / location=Cvel_scaffold2142:15831-22200(+) / protein_length=749 / sequence_SO=supercontig / SO=protein_coding / is_pseudo=false
MDRRMRKGGGSALRRAERRLLLGSTFAVSFAQAVSSRHSSAFLQTDWGLTARHPHHGRTVLRQRLQGINQGRALRTRQKDRLFEAIDAFCNPRASTDVNRPLNVPWDGNAPTLDPIQDQKWADFCVLEVGSRASRTLFMPLDAHGRRESKFPGLPFEALDNVAHNGGRLDETSQREEEKSYQALVEEDEDEDEGEGGSSSRVPPSRITRILSDVRHLFKESGFQFARPELCLAIATGTVRSGPMFRSLRSALQADFSLIRSGHRAPLRAFDLHALPHSLEASISALFLLLRFFSVRRSRDGFQFAKPAARFERGNVAPGAATHLISLDVGGGTTEIVFMRRRRDAIPLPGGRAVVPGVADFAPLLQRWQSDGAFLLELGSQKVTQDIERLVREQPHVSVGVIRDRVRYHIFQALISAGLVTREHLGVSFPSEMMQQSSDNAEEERNSHEKEVLRDTLPAVSKVAGTSVLLEESGGDAETSQRGQSRPASAKAAALKPPQMSWAELRLLIDFLDPRPEPVEEKRKRLREFWSDTTDDGKDCAVLAIGGAFSLLYSLTGRHPGCWQATEIAPIVEAQDSCLGGREESGEYTSVRSPFFVGRGPFLTEDRLDRYKEHVEDHAALAAEMTELNRLTDSASSNPLPAQYAYNLAARQKRLHRLRYRASQFAEGIESCLIVELLRILKLLFGARTLNLMEVRLRHACAALMTSGIDVRHMKGFRALVDAKGDAVFNAAAANGSRTSEKPATDPNR